MVPLIFDEDFIEMPLVSGAGAAPAQLVGVGLPELGAPPPDRLVTHRDTAYEHQLLDLTEAEREPEAASRIKSGAANPAPKLATLIAGMSAGAD